MTKRLRIPAVPVLQKTGNYLQICVRIKTCRRQESRAFSVFPAVPTKLADFSYHYNIREPFQGAALISANDAQFLGTENKGDNYQSDHLGKPVT